MRTTQKGKLVDNLVFVKTIKAVLSKGKYRFKSSEVNLESSATTSMAQTEGFQF